MKRLTQNISSEWQQAANMLRPKHVKKKIVAYVESYDDIAFWRDILDEYETPDIRFEIMLPSRTTLGKGKKLALTHDLGPYMIACVDADYDYLLKGATPVSQQLCTSPYVLHTYVYAIENYQCYAPGLHKSCTRATLNDRTLIDFETFFAEYSRIIWPLFVWNIWSYRHGRDCEFGITDMTETITFRDINIHNIAHSLETLRHKVNKRVNRLHQRFPEGKKTYKPLMQELLDMGIHPEDTYLYIQGHALKDGVALPLLTPVCTQLRREREREIEQYALHATQFQNELSSYRHSSIPIDIALRKSTTYRKSAPFQTLKADIARLIAEVGTAK